MELQSWKVVFQRLVQLVKIKYTEKSERGDGEGEEGEIL